MFRRNASFALLVALLTVVPARAAYANVIEPFLLPGVFQLFGLLAIPATVLVAVVERPFVSRAGIGRQALYHCFCANVVSTLIGFALVPFTVLGLEAMPYLWIVIALAISVLAEGLYYRFLAQMRGQALIWSWVIWGNVASSAVLLGVSIAGYAIDARRPLIGFRLEPYWWPLVLVTVVGTAVAFLVGWRRANEAQDTTSTELVPPAAEGTQV